MKSREVITKIMGGWAGAIQGGEVHKSIIDTYNNHVPRPRGYKVTYADAWCATTVSAAFIKAGYIDLFPLECSCFYVIEGAKRMGIWQEKDDYVPKPGDSVLYDWQDNGVGDCIGTPEHIGLVMSVEGNIIHVLEGNKSKSVSWRSLAVNGQYIRGFVTPKFDDGAADNASEPSVSIQPGTVATAPASSVIGTCSVELKTFLKGACDPQVRSIQILLSALDFKGKDGNDLAIDGELGSNTAHAIECFQRSRGMEGINFGTVAAKTWQLLLNAKG